MKFDCCFVDKYYTEMLPYLRISIEMGIMWVDQLYMCHPMKLEMFIDICIIIMLDLIMCKLL